MGVGDIKRALGRIPWRRLTAEEARELALKGEHLRPRPPTPLGETGFVGAPPGIATAKDLAALRARLDEVVRTGAYGADWYPEARAWNVRASAGDPELARRLAAGQAIYSPHASPEEALNFTTEQLHRTALEGPEAAARTPPNMFRQARQFGEVLAGAEPAEVIRGGKTGPYFDFLDPARPGPRTAPVNDTWIGRLFGYPERGYEPTEHSFMSGEWQLALDRAKEAGLLPAEADVGAPQAAAWVGSRLEKAREPATVHRVEHETTGEGPYRSGPGGFRDVVGELGLGKGPAFEGPQPTAAVDFAPEQRSRFHEGLRFGFPTPQMAERWFTPEGLERLRAAGFPLKKVLGKNIEPSSTGRQVWFEPEPPHVDVARQREAKAGIPEAAKRLTAYETTELAPGRETEHLSLPEGGAPEERAAAAEMLSARLERAGGPRPFKEPGGGLVIPAGGTPERRRWDTDTYFQNVKDFFGHENRYIAREVPLDQLTPLHDLSSGMDARPSRSTLYARMLQAGEELPPPVVKPDPVTGQLLVVDGNRRYHLARQMGRQTMTVLTVEQPPKGRPFPEQYNAPWDTRPAPRYDPYYRAVGIAPQEPVVAGRGQFTEGGETYYNPNRTARPLVARSARGGISEPSREILHGVNVLRSAVDVQAAGAWHTVIPTATPRLQNAARMEFGGRKLHPSDVASIVSIAERHGLNAINTGDAFTLTKDWGGAGAAEFKKALAGFQQTMAAARPEYTLGRWQGELNPMRQYGEGRVTRQVLEEVPERLGRLLNTPELRRLWRERNPAERRASRELGVGPPRADVQKLRSILSRGGPEALRAHVAKFGYGGLPAAALMTQQKEE